MTELRVRVFGPLRVSLDGTAARIGAGRQQAVLGRLILAGGRTITAHRLVDDIWEGAPPAHAASVLQVQIHNLRRVLEPQRRPRTPARVLVSEGAGYALRLEAGCVDSWRFEQLLAEYEQMVCGAGGPPDAGERYRLLGEALNCWHGNAFESFAGASWAMSEVARLTDLRNTATEMRAEAALELGRTGEVVSVLRRQLEEYPGREESTRLLALAQHRLGQQIEALATVRRTRDHLRSEFGMDPGQQLRELESAILNQSLDLDRDLATVLPSSGIVAGLDRFGAVDFAPSRSVPAEDSGEIGSDAGIGIPPGEHYREQRRAVVAAAAAARRRGLRVTWLVGESGMGKSTLIAGVLRHLEGQGWTTALGVCPQVDGAPPAWVWTEILTGLGGSLPVPESEGPRTDAFSLVQAVTARCRELGHRTPIALVLEDAHRADQATLQVLRQLATWLRGQPILVVLTVRRSEFGPALRAAEAALGDHGSERVQLCGLGHDGVRDILRRAGLPAPDEDLVGTLHRRTGGNPLFLGEFAAVLAAGGDPDVLPERIRSVLLERIERLPPGVLAVLQHIAVWGTTVDLDTLAELSGVGEDELVDLIDTAAAADLLMFDSCGRIVPDHPLVQDAVYDSIPPLRRGRMHWHTMEFVERRATGHSADLGEITALAHHASRGVSRVGAAHALDHVTAAALTCDNLGMRAQAARWWRTAVGLHELAEHTLPSADPVARQALLTTLCAYVDALAHDGCVRSARAVRERALEVAEQLPGRDATVRALTCWRAPVIRGIRDWHFRPSRIHDALGRGLADEDDPHRRAWLLVASVFEAACGTDADLVRGYADQARRLAAAVGEPELVCAALNAVAHTADEAARDPRRDSIADELLAVAEAANLLDYQALAHFLRYRAACADVDPVAAAEHALRALDCAVSGEFRQPVDQLLAFPAMIALLRGDPSEAERHYRRFTNRMIRPGVANTEAIRLIGVLAVAWARGSLTPLVATLARCYRTDPALIAPIYTVALLQAGETDSARAVFAEHPEIPAGPYRRMLTAFRGFAAARLGQREDARRLYDALLPESGTIIGFDTGAVVFGPADTVLAELAATLGEHAESARLRANADALLGRITEAMDSLGPLLDSIEQRCAHAPEAFAGFWT